MEVARHLKKMMQMFGEGLEQSDFIDAIFKFYQNRHLSAFQKKQRKEALINVFNFMDENSNLILLKHLLIIYLRKRDSRFLITCTGVDYSMRRVS